MDFFCVVEVRGKKFPKSVELILHCYRFKSRIHKIEIQEEKWVTVFDVEDIFAVPDDDGSPPQPSSRVIGRNHSTRLLGLATSLHPLPTRCN